MMRDLSPWSRFGVLVGQQMLTRSYLLYTFVKHLSSIILYLNILLSIFAVYIEIGLLSQDEKTITSCNAFDDRCNGRTS